MMPKVIGNDSLIARVNEVQGRMYRQSNELGRLSKAVRRYKEENARLRELIREAIYAKDDADWASIVSAAIGLGVRCDDGDEEVDV